MFEETSNFVTNEILQLSATISSILEELATEDTSFLKVM